MDEEWLNSRLAPRLAEFHDRQWTAESLAATVKDLQSDVDAAVADGMLSPAGRTIAHHRIEAAVGEIRGVHTRRVISRADVTGAQPVAERVDQPGRES